MIDGGYMKLHLGCGKRQLKGFFHVDIADFPHIDFKSSVADLSFIRDSSVDQIYTSHTFEYFDRFEAVQVLAEWHRVLKRGGDIFITVPDFDKLIQIYNLTGLLQNITGPLFGRWDNSNAASPIYHKTVWNFADLKHALNFSGFVGIEEFNPKVYLNAIDPGYDDYSLAFHPHMDSLGIQVSLAIKANKV